MLSSRPEIQTHCTVSVIGSSGVGQTSLIKRYAEGSFKDKSRYRPTIGPMFYVKKEGDVTLELWDLAVADGKLGHQSITCRLSDAFLFLFDVTDQDSFDKVKSWVNKVRLKLQPGSEPLCFMVGTKTDLVDKRVVSEQKAKEIAQSLGMMYYEVSAKNNEGVDKLFSDLSKTLNVIKQNEIPEWHKPWLPHKVDNRSFWQKHYKKIIGGLVAAVIIAAVAVALWPLIVGLPVFGTVATALTATSLVASQGATIGATAVAATAVGVVGAVVSTFVGYLTDAVSERIKEKKEEGISEPIIVDGFDTASITKGLGGAKLSDEKKVEPSVHPSAQRNAALFRGVISSEPTLIRRPKK